MYQLTYSKSQDNLILQFPWSDKDFGFVSSLERGDRDVAKPWAAGDLVQVCVHPSPWNVQLVKKHCTPLALTPMARIRMEAASLQVADKSNVLDNEPTITDWKFYRVPFRHQVISWKYAIDNPFSALFLDMGLGKTFVAWNVLGYFYSVKNSAKPSLVLIPKSSFESWEREARLCGFPGEVVSLIGDAKRKRKLLAGPGQVFLCTYESAINLTEELTSREWLYVVLDESTKIKNHAAQRSKAACQVGQKADRRIILTGYPVTQSYVDLFGQYKFLDPTIYGTSFSHFRNTYCVMGGWNAKNVIGYNNINELVGRMNKRCLRFTKAQCLDLPPKTHQTYKFDLNPEERRTYDALKKEMVAKFVDRQVLAQNALVAGLRLVQVCTGYVGGVVGGDGDEPEVKTLGSSKIELLEEILRSVPPDENIILWCRFKHNIRQIEHLLATMRDNNPKEAQLWTNITFTGELSAQQRKDAITLFQSRGTRIFLGILQAGGHGLDLTAASYVIYYSQDYSIERRMQSEDRAHRIGQTRNVTYIDLVARQSIEESILKCLGGKKKESDVVFEFARDPAAFMEGR